jgi:putative FmdB family regulatory protein
MPTYQYICAGCADEFEVVQSFSDDPISECPKCGAAVRKQFSSVGVVFKGSGFYRTDSRKKSEPAAKTTESKPKPPAKPSVDN